LVRLNFGLSCWANNLGRAVLPFYKSNSGFLVTLYKLFHSGQLPTAVYSAN
jgi:hypothetical protein